MKTIILSFALLFAATFNLNAGVPGIQGPVLILHGTKDTIVRQVADFFRALL